MRYRLSIERTSEIADSAISHMTKNDIPATPENFAIWFEYAAGANPPLARMLNKLIEDDRKFDRDVSWKIFQKIGGSSGQATPADDQVKAIAEQMLDALKQVGKDTEFYEERLQNFSGTLDGANDAAEYRKLVDDMVAESKSMASHTTVLQDKLSE